MAYFKLKYFSIWDSTNKQRFEIDDNEYKNLTSIKYDLDDYRDQHYDPPEFFNYLKELSNKNLDVTYLISYTYEYFNHHHINEYKNGMNVFNGEITDKLIG
jgi:hypothetical protein